MQKRAIGYDPPFPHRGIHILHSIPCCVFSFGCDEGIMISIQREPIDAAPSRSQAAAEPAKAKFAPDYIRDISEQVFRIRLEQDSEGNVARMIEKDKDGGEKLRSRAGQYDPLTRAYLKALGVEP
jgi:hypothetical protein